MLAVPQDFDSISAAMEVAENGDTILLAAGKPTCDTTFIQEQRHKDGISSPRTEMHVHERCSLYDVWITQDIPVDAPIRDLYREQA
jgi:hypothetical protein